MIRSMAASARSNCLRLAGNAFARIRRTVLAQRRAAPFSRLTGGFEGEAIARFLGLEELFEGQHFSREIIEPYVRWHMRFDVCVGWRCNRRRTDPTNLIDNPSLT
jgi:hypothetical protein